MYWGRGHARCVCFQWRHESGGQTVEFSHNYLCPNSGRRDGAGSGHNEELVLKNGKAIYMQSICILSGAVKSNACNQCQDSCKFVPLGLALSMQMSFNDTCMVLVNHRHFLQHQAVASWVVNLL